MKGRLMSGARVLRTNLLPAAGAVAHVTVDSDQVGIGAASEKSPPLIDGSVHVSRRVALVTVRVPTPDTVNCIRKCLMGLLSVSSLAEDP